jgi:hypothetical protein
VVTADFLTTRRAQVAASPDLSRLLLRLTERAYPLLERLPPMPEAKALLSMDGGRCPRDGGGLMFDPWRPTVHRCPRCGAEYHGERHARWWARFQHLWLAERAAHLAALAAIGDHAAAAGRARELLAAYGERYFEYPNRDNVLGPSRLFFSTYLESIWLSDYLAAAVLLRESEQLDEGTGRLVSQVADEAANLIGEFDEGLSNRQTWHDAALAAIAVWFEDEDLLRRAVEAPSGLLAHLLQGFGRDGMWYEGENYHLFALRGLLTGLQWTRSAGFDPFAEPELAGRLDAALRAPALSALPDATFPARKDSRFGVSLAQPMYLELWEVGWAGQRGRGQAGQRGSGAAGQRVGAAGAGDGEAAEPEEQQIEDWLAFLYELPAPAADTFDSYLHEAGDPAPARRGRQDLSWWMLLAMAPALAGAADRWRPASVLLDSQGLAILRTGGRYASLECGAYGGGHGHPDRLHLTLHQDGVHWLPDFGAGSYVSRDLFWYRSTLAHNAPRLDGVSQTPGDATCEYFDASGDWGWVRGRFGPVSRTLVSGPAYLLDLVELAGDVEHRLELPWHFPVEVEVRSPGCWEPASLEDEFVSEPERFVPGGTGPIVLTAALAAANASSAGASLTAALEPGAELIRATAPGAPGAGPARFYLQRGEGRTLRFVTVLARGGAAPALTARREGFAVETAAGTDEHRLVVEGWQIQGPAGTVLLRGRRAVERTVEPLISPKGLPVQTAAATRVDQPPPLDGSLEGFEHAGPLALDHEDQYRRSEEPYAGPEEFSAVAYASWDDDALYLAVDVTKPDVIFRPAAAPPLLLDNEPDEIHSDGLQLYLRLEPEGEMYGFLVVPSESAPRLRVRVAGGSAGDPGMVTGDWRRSDSGYVVTLAVRVPGWEVLQQGDRVGFDLLVNEMLPGRERRAGQLVWSGGGGWVWLRGDRQDPAQLGELELA